MVFILNPKSTQMKNRITYLIMLLLLLGINTAFFAQNQSITITRETNSDKSVSLHYEKKMPGSYYINVEFSNQTNCQESDYKGVLNGGSGIVTKIRPINPQENINFSYKYTYIMGVLNPKVDSLFQYTLPFKNGKKVKIYEAGNIGEKFLGADKPLNWKSYIVNSKNPDTICSMRKGIVVKVVNDYDDDSSVNKHYTSKRNSLIIEHEDGTFANYSGFKKNSFKVKLGQTVYPQTQLGILELFSKDENIYRFDFSIYYLFNVDFDLNEKQTFKKRQNRYKYITPHFLTPTGLEVVESKKEYTSFFNEIVLLQEFTRSEKKKYAKDPVQFR